LSVVVQALPFVWIALDIN